MNKRNVFTLIGFTLFLIGFMSIVLTLVGMNYSFLSWIESLPAPFGFVTKLVLMFGGMIMLYISKTYEPLNEKEVS